MRQKPIHMHQLAALNLGAPWSTILSHKAGRLVPDLFFGGGMMLAPVGSIASTVERDLGEEKFGGKPALGEVSSDSLLRLFR